MLKLSTRLLVMFFVLSLVAAGCAKKPEDGEDEGAAESTPSVTVVEDQTVSAVEEQPVEEPATSGSSHISAPPSLFGDNAAELQRIHFEFDQYVLTD